MRQSGFFATQSRMLNSVLAVFFVVSSGWTQDQAVSSRTSMTSNAANPQIFSCPVGQDYLQRDLNGLAFYSTLSTNLGVTPLNARILRIAPLLRPFIHPTCVEGALRNVTAGEPLKKGEAFRTNRFIRCNSQGQPIDHQDEPCLSSEYKALMHASFELATTCLKEYVSGSKDKRIQDLWVEGYFKMIAKESGLHVNAVSRIGAMGIGQLLPEYIVDFQRITLPRLREFLNRPGASNGCKKLASEVLTDERIEKLYTELARTNNRTNRISKSFSINQCSNIDIQDGQPILNLLISFANLQLFKEKSIDEILADPRYRSAFRNLNEEQLQELEIKLVTWSYNLGAAGLKNRVIQTINRQYRGSYIRSVDGFIRDAGGNNNYVFAIEDRYRLLKGTRQNCRNR